MANYLYIVLSRVADLFVWAIIARAVLSWFTISPYNPISVFLVRITEPLLAPLRRLIPRAGVLDITPLIAILVLQFVVKGLLAYLLL
ncbi:MAG: YggT family protein [Chloroflexota bacterium]